MVFQGDTQHQAINERPRQLANLLISSRNALTSTQICLFLSQCGVVHKTAKDCNKKPN